MEQRVLSVNRKYTSKELDKLLRKGWAVEQYANCKISNIFGFKIPETHDVFILKR